MARAYTCRESDNNHAMRVVTIMLLLVGCAGAPAKRSETREPLPELTLPLVRGGTWSSTSARGSVLVIDIWASWCKPCGKAFPKLDALARSGVAVVAISIDEDPAAIDAFLAQFPLAAPVVHDAEQTVTGAPLRISRLPTVLVVDRTGTIRHRLEEPTERDYDHLGDLVAGVQ